MDRVEAVPVGRVDVDDLDGVAALPTGVGGVAELLGLGRGLPDPAVRADQQHVVGRPIGRGDADRAGGGRHLAPLVAEVAVARRPPRPAPRPPGPRRPAGAARRLGAPLLLGPAPLPLGRDGDLAAQDGAGELGGRDAAGRPGAGAGRSRLSGRARRRTSARTRTGGAGGSLVGKVRSGGRLGGARQFRAIGVGRRAGLVPSAAQFPTGGRRTGGTAGRRPGATSPPAPTTRGSRRGPGPADGRWPPEDRRTRWRRG